MHNHKTIDKYPHKGMIKIKEMMQWQEWIVHAEPIYRKRQINMSFTITFREDAQAEINSKEYYKSIIDFISSYEIRKGEFEGNEYVIMKVDRDNFILFPEYDDGRKGLQIPFSLSIYKEDLINAMNQYARGKGII